MYTRGFEILMTFWFWIQIVAYFLRVLLLLTDCLCFVGRITSDEKLVMCMRFFEKIVYSNGLLIAGQNGDENTWRSVLYKAVVEGDWERTKNLLDSHPEGRSTRLSKGETILHTAVLCKHVQLVEEIVKLMTIGELEARLPYRDGATALHLAASGGVVKIAEPIVNKNRNLLCLKDNSDYLPVALAYATGQKNMTKYLFSVIGVEELNLDRSHSGATMLTTAIMSQDYGN